MSSRHTPRQAERDLRIHDPRPPSAHPHIHLHVNGNSQPLNTSTIPQSRGHPSPTVSANGAAPPLTNVQKLAQANEQTWLLIGRVAEQMGNWEHALSAYENALRHNPNSLTGLISVAGIARIKEDYKKAVDYFQRVVDLQRDNGEVWSSLGHCYLMQDDLQKAYSAYQQALYLLPAPKDDPKLWYGIGILYDRYGSLDHAEEAFASVLRMNKDFDKSNEILFRLGIIYKQRSKYNDSLQCFDQILRNPPNPLAHADIWFQIGHVYEQQGDLGRAKVAYEKVVQDNPNHAKVLQQLGWLHHQDGSSFQNQETAVTYLTRSLEADPHDAQSWYLLGRAYMAGQKYNKAYEAYQQAVYRDGRNPTFWCSIGVLYFQINQYRDALDAYSRAIRINPYISEVWFDLGSLYESCNNQISDAIDAYARAAELDPRNTVITQRLELLKQAQATGAQLPAAPGPQDVHPTAYANTVVQPPGLTGPPLLLQSGSGVRLPSRSDIRNGDPNLPLPPPPAAQVGPGRNNSPGPFRGGPPPPVILDDSRHSQSRPQLAPMEVDRPPHGRDQPSLYTSTRGPSRGLAGHANILLHQPVPQPPANGLTHTQSHPHDQHLTNARPIRASSASTSPAPRGHSPRSSYSSYPTTGRGPSGPGHQSRSPRSYPPEFERDSGVDRRGLPNDRRDWDREHRARHMSDYPAPSQQSFTPRAHSPASSYRGHSPRPTREYSPPLPSPRNAHQGIQRAFPLPWTEAKSGPPSITRSPGPPEPHARRYDPRMDGRDPREYDAMDTRPDIRSRPASLHGSPESTRGGRHQTHGPQHAFSRPGARSPPSPRSVQQPLAPDQRSGRRRGTGREKETAEPAYQGDVQKRKKRTSSKRKDEAPHEMYVPERSNGPQGPSFRITYPASKSNSSPEPVSSNGSGSASRSVQPSPTSATPHAPSREVDEDYDEGVAEVLMDLASSYRQPAGSQAQVSGRASPRPVHGNRASSSSTARDRDSPALSSSSNQKRPHSPGSEDNVDMKRSRIEAPKRRLSSPSAGGSRPTSLPSTRPSPIPFRTQAPSSPQEVRQTMDSGHTYRQSSPPLPTTLPPHPRPIGSGMALPPIATISPTSISPGREEDRMQVDGTHRSRSISPPPPSRAKISEVMNHPKKSPTPPSMQNMDRDHAH